MMRKNVTVVAALLGVLAVVQAGQAQPVVVEATPDPSLERLPILFHHGFNDDGRLWAFGSDGNGTGSAAEYWDLLEIRSA